MDIILALKKFAVAVAESEKLTLPIKIELLDVGTNRIFELDLNSQDSERNYVFSQVRGVSSAISQPRPYTVRFTASEGRPILRDFPE